MKRIVSLFLCCILLLGLVGCTAPDSFKLDLYQGYGRGLRLIHLNASDEKNSKRIDAFAQALTGAKALQKDISLFAYYPDFHLEIKGKALKFDVTADGVLENISVTDQADGTITAVIDKNGDFVDFYFPGPAPEASDVIYRSPLTAEELLILVHQ